MSKSLSEVSQSIDRCKVVRRHNVELRTFDPHNPVSVGNGEFAFTGDVTGLQTFSDYFEQTIPLCTQAQWGWHSFPMPKGLDADQLRYTPYNMGGRSVGYAVDEKGQEQLFHYLRQNPHRFHLGRIRLKLHRSDHRKVTPQDLTQVHQVLDLWTGVVTSRFVFQEVGVVVRTCVAGPDNCLAVRIQSDLIRHSRLQVEIDFPYGSPEMSAADWACPELHQSRVIKESDQSVRIARQLDQDHYFVSIRWETPARLMHPSEHTFVLEPLQEQSFLEFTCGFAPRLDMLPDRSVTSAFDSSERFWGDYWGSGAALDLSGSTDSRALELERRVVLSQYLMRVNSSGALPPAETGLTCNSWYGKAHLEMHWWHGVHFAFWGRLSIFEKSLHWYKQILPSARSIARRQGYQGVRWPKMVDPMGTDSPSPVGPLLIWQQPHPIYYAELCYRQIPTLQTLLEWEEIVSETAQFMVDFLIWNPKTGQYDLGPSLKTVSENTDPRSTQNPTFELCYWRFGLQTAQRWRERLHKPRISQWDEKLSRLAALPCSEGKYLLQQGCWDTYTRWNWEHPAVLGIKGMLPGDGVDDGIFRETVRAVIQNWQWDRCWGWDFPLAAMAATRAGLPEYALEMLFHPSPKNTYSRVGHNYQRPNLPLYLPGNGGLLAAVAMMVAGWDGTDSSVQAPGFPSQGWMVRHEGFHKIPAV